MRTRTGQINMTQPFATHLCLRDFNAALVADHAAVLHALVLAAQAFPISNWPKDAGAKQAIALRFERTVIDRLWLGDFAVRPLTDLVRRSERDANRLKVRRELRFLLMESKHVLSPFRIADFGLRI